MDGSLLKPAIVLTCIVAISAVSIRPVGAQTVTTGPQQIVDGTGLVVGPVLDYRTTENIVIDFARTSFLIDGQPVTLELQAGVDERLLQQGAPFIVAFQLPGCAGQAFFTHADTGSSLPIDAFARVAMVNEQQPSPTLRGYRPEPGAVTQVGLTYMSFLLYENGQCGAISLVQDGTPAIAFDTPFAPPYSIEAGATGTNVVAVPAVSPLGLCLLAVCLLIAAIKIQRG